MISLTKLRKKYLALPLVLAFVVVGLGIFWSLSRNEGQINDTAVAAQTRLPPYLSYDGTYITFRYASKYQVEKLPVADKNLELATLTANTVFGKKLAVSVAKTEDGTLDTNSAYILRKSHQDLYSVRSIKIDGGQAAAYTKNDGLEETVFIPRGDKVAMFSFSTTGTVDDLKAESETVLESFQWKQ